jgi:bacillithiol system protein YtxJ
MTWQLLTSEFDFAQLMDKSNTAPQVIFKHSTRCSISKVVKHRLDKSSAPDHAEFHFLDLIAYRSLSNKVADQLGVVHESPQVLLIRNGKCIYHESHYGITMDDIEGEVL